MYTNAKRIMMFRFSISEGRDTVSYTESLCRILQLSVTSAIDELR